MRLYEHYYQQLMLRASAGVTYWSTHAKADTELGYSVRPLSQGVIDAFGRG